MIEAAQFRVLTSIPAFFPQIFAQDLSPKKAAELNAGQIPINAAILGSPSGPVGWHAIRSWYAVSGADRSSILPSSTGWPAALARSLCSSMMPATPAVSRITRRGS